MDGEIDPKSFELPLYLKLQEIEEIQKELIQQQALIALGETRIVDLPNDVTWDALLLAAQDHRIHSELSMIGLVIQSMSPPYDLEALAQLDQIYY